MKKKNLLYLLALLITFSLFPACSDDDKDPEPEPTPEPELNWADYIGSYGDKNTLVLNGAANSDIVVTVGKGSGDYATISFANLFPEAATIAISDIEMKESNGVFTFTKEQQIDETLFTITGTLTPGTVARAEQTLASLSVNASRKVVSDIVGNWSMGYNESDILPGVMVPDFRIIANTGDQNNDDFLNMSIPAVIQQLMLPKVEGVNIVFNEGGTFDFSWRPVGSGQDMTLVDVIAGIENPAIAAVIQGVFANVSIQYYTRDNILYMALDKQILSLLSLLEMFPVDLGDINIQDIIDMLFVDNGGAYYALPLYMKDDEGTRLFYMDKNMVLPMIQVAVPLLLNMDLGSLGAFLGLILPNLPGIIENADQFDIGMGFVKK